MKKRMILLAAVCIALLAAVGACADVSTFETVTVVKNTGDILPIQINHTGGNVLILVQEKGISFTESCADRFKQGWSDVRDSGVIPDTNCRVVPFDMNDWNDADKLAAIDAADYVLVNSVVGSMADMGCKTWRTAAPKKYIDHASGAGKKTVLISMGDPGDVQLFPNADAILAAVYDPADAITVAFGFYGAFGRLPANIYAYDPVTDSYNTKKVVYPKDFGIEYDPITAMNKTAIKIEFYQAEYSGSEIRPSIFVEAEITHSDGRHTKVLTEGKDYFVTYSNNIEVGTATVTATGMGCYIGTNSAHFEIIPRQDPPLTGDGSSPALWTVLLSASLLIAIQLLRKHRRNGRR